MNKAKLWVIRKDDNTLGSPDRVTGDKVALEIASV